MTKIIYVDFSQNIESKTGYVCVFEYKSGKRRPSYSGQYVVESLTDQDCYNGQYESIEDMIQVMKRNTCLPEPRSCFITRARNVEQVAYQLRRKYRAFKPR